MKNILVLRQGIVYIPVLFLMNALFHLNGLIFSTVVSDIISTVIAVILSLRFHKDFAENCGKAGHPDGKEA